MRVYPTVNAKLKKGRPSLRLGLNNATFMPPEPKVIMLRRPQIPQIKALRLSQANHFYYVNTAIQMREVVLFLPFGPLKHPKPVPRLSPGEHYTQKGKALALLGH